MGTGFRYDICVLLILQGRKYARVILWKLDFGAGKKLSVFLLPVSSKVRLATGLRQDLTIFIFFRRRRRYATTTACLTRTSDNRSGDDDDDDDDDVCARM